MVLASMLTLGLFLSITNIVSAFTVGGSRLSINARYPSPLSDPFYKPPDGFEKTQLGTILRQRVVTDSIYLLKSIRLKPEAAWQFLYRTQNSVGEPEATVVTVLKPQDAKPGNLFVQSYFTNAAFAGCNPSFTLLGKDPEDNELLHYQTFFAITALSNGWYVSIADDGGPQVSQPSGLQMGYATLDSIRAVLSSTNITGIDPKPITTLNGYSGGSIAAGWATELQPHYAPEISIAGTAMGGVLTSVWKILPEINKSWYAVFSPASILGLAHDYTNLTSWLADNLVPKYAQEFHEVESQCFKSNLRWANMDLDLFYKRGYDSLKDPIPSSVIQWAGTMGRRGTPKTPMYLYSNAGDQIAHLSTVDEYVQNHCSNGGNIYHERNLSPLDHGIAPLYRFPGHMRWLRDRQDGKPVARGCSSSNVTVSGFGALLDGESEFYFRAVLLVIGAMLGL